MAVGRAVASCGMWIVLPGKECGKGALRSLEPVGVNVSGSPWCDLCLLLGTLS